MQPTRRPEPLHRSLTFSEGQMAGLGAIVEPLVRPMVEVSRDLSFGGTIRAQFVGDDPLLHKAMTLDQADQKPLCRLLVSLGLKKFFQNDTMLINSPPEPE